MKVCALYLQYCAIYTKMKHIERSYNMSTLKYLPFTK